MLVVIAIIGVLVGLLLPAVNAAREASRRTSCSNNIRQIAMAAINYETTKKKLVPYQDDFGPSSAPKRGSWAVSLLGGIEQQPIRDEWDDGAIQPGNNDRLRPNIPLFQCPSDNDNNDESYARNSYAINVGHLWELMDIMNRLPMLDYVDDSVANWKHLNTVNATQIDNSISYNHAKGSEGFQSKGLQSGGIKDGNSNTLWFAENLQADSWGYSASDDSVRYRLGVGWVYALGSVPDSDLQGSTVVTIPKLTEVPVAPSHADAAKLNALPINGNKLTIAKGELFAARPSSSHAGGVVVVVMADGSVRVLSEGLEYHVYQALLTPNTRKSDVPYNRYLLKADDYE
ncbi:MAG: DUF1559 domain-containing protein [Pirellulaceae bacterium]|nr:DUF1559 domain-containing protein [Pirellulaceae bacterium]